MFQPARLFLTFSTIGVVAGLSKIHAASNGYDFTGSSRFAWAIAYILVLLTTAYSFGLPELPRSWRSAFAASALATGCAALAVSFLQLLTGDALLPRFVVFGTALCLDVVYPVASMLAKDRRDRAEQRDRVLLVSSNAAEDARALQCELDGPCEKPAHVVGAMTIDEAALRTSPLPLSRRAAELGATVIVLDRQAQADDEIVAQTACLHEKGLRVRSLSLFYDEWLGKLPVTELLRTSLFFDIGSLHRERYARLKRVLDLAIASLGMTFFLLVTPFVLIGNMVGNRGPLFYRQVRVGEGGFQFSILKFRTMRPGNGSQSNEWTTEDDPRITPFGHFLRRSHLDEVPQMVNIVRGQLSIVGPRPEQPRYVQELAAKLPFYDLRHLAKPGLTGWAQVKYGYAGSESDAIEKLQYEFYYLRHQGLMLDLRVVGRTFRSVFQRSGR